MQDALSQLRGVSSGLGAGRTSDTIETLQSRAREWEKKVCSSSFFFHDLFYFLLLFIIVVVCMLCAVYCVLYSLLLLLYVLGVN